MTITPNPDPFLGARTGKIWSKGDNFDTNLGGKCLRTSRSLGQGPVAVLFKRPAVIYGAAAAQPWPMLAPGTVPAGRGARLATLALT